VFDGADQHTGHAVVDDQPALGDPHRCRTVTDLDFYRCTYSRLDGRRQEPHRFEAELWSGAVAVRLPTGQPTKMNFGGGQRHEGDPDPVPRMGDRGRGSRP
jgi:hypothetical protein